MCLHLLGLLVILLLEVLYSLFFIGNNLAYSEAVVGNENLAFRLPPTMFIQIKKKDKRKIKEKPISRS